MEMRRSNRRTGKSIAVDPNENSSVHHGEPKASLVSRGSSPGRRTGKTQQKVVQPASDICNENEESAHHTHSPQERRRKGISHGMSPHDRGVLGAQARWSKVRAEHEGKEVASPTSKRGG